MTNDPNSQINIPQGFQYTAPNYGLYGDNTTLRSPSLPSPTNEPIGAPRYKVIKLRDGLYYWWVEFFSSNGGYRQRGRFDELHASRAWSSMDGRGRGKSHLPPLSTAVTNLDPGDDTFMFVSAVNAFGSMAFSCYNTAGANYTPIFKASGATLSQLTYSKGTTHRIRGLVNLVVNGNPYVAVLKQGAAIELLSDLGSTPTSFGSMHTDTVQAWAAVNTTLPDTSILIFSNDDISSLAYSDAYSVQPTIQGHVPIGGGGFGATLGAINNGDPRVYFSALDTAAAGSTQIPGSGPNNYQGAIYSCNQRGTDVKQWPTLTRFVSQFVMYNGGIAYVSGDGQRAVFDNGREHWDMPLQRDRQRYWLVETTQLLYSSNVTCMGFYKKGDDLYLELNALATNGQSMRWIEWLDFNARELIPASGVKYYTTPSQLYSASAHGSLPVDEASGRLWSWFSPATGADFWSIDQPSVSTAISDTTFQSEVSGVTYRPTMEIPGLEGKPKTYHRAYYGGQLSPIAGLFTTAAGLRLDIGGTPVAPLTVGGSEHFSYQTETWTGGLNAASRWKTRSDNRQRFRELIVKETLTGGLVTADTYHYGDNILPYSIEGLAYDNDSAFKQWSKGQVKWS